MSDIDVEALDREHRSSFTTFRHLVLFAAAHIGLTLACVALAFIGHAELIAFLIWLAGTVVLIAALTVHRASVAAPARRGNLRRV